MSLSTWFAPWSRLGLRDCSRFAAACEVTMKVHRQAILFMGLISAATLASAENMTCGSWIVTPEVSVDELLKKCGQPTTKETTVEDVRTHGRTGSIKVGETTSERWIYKRGNSSIPMAVTIVDGEVTAIESVR